MIDRRYPPIDRFEGDFLFLSNFYTGHVFLWDTEFLSAEHAYQYEKVRPFMPMDSQRYYMNIRNPGKFKKEIKRWLIENPYCGFKQEQWDRVKLSVMREVVGQKFKNVLLRDRLVMTAPRELIEGNTWNDAFWGQPLDKHGNRTKPGQNWLGKILMEIRDGA